MKIIASRGMKSCLDGTLNTEKMLDAAIDRPFIYHLGNLGRLEYFPSFARPFFRITRPESFVIKGVEGDHAFEVLFLDASAKEDRIITDQVNGFHTCRG